MRALAALASLALAAAGCAPQDDQGADAPAPDPLRVADARPLARYWWFAEPIDTLDVAADLDWLAARGFGGVELAFVYPPGRMADPRDSTPNGRPAWLSAEWQRLVDYAQRAAAARGLRCDVTAGSLWPFGDPDVPWAAGSKRFGDSPSGVDTAWREAITAHWAWPTPGRVVDHLQPQHYLAYLTRTLDSFPAPRGPASLFVDSWEVDARGLWTEGFGESFLAAYGYRIEPHMDGLYADDPALAPVRYDYHRHLSERVRRFYRDFDSVANARGYASRGQVSGAPVDLLAGYGTLDVPEGEALLFEPEFNRIPASAAALAGRPLVSAETFTCLYGWPRDYLRREQVADLKLLADALLANGVNQVVWHGKPLTRRGARDSTNFYATVHLGDSGALAPHLPAFNAYLARAAGQLRRGRPYYTVAQYLPTEDAWAAGEMPRARQFVWAWGHYEMRYVYPALRDEATLWFGGEALATARRSDTAWHFGEHAFRGLVFDVATVDAKTVRALTRLMAPGLGPGLLLTRKPRLAGTAWSAADSLALRALLARDDVWVDAGLRASSTGNIVLGTRLFEAADELPPHALRLVGDTLLAFFAPQAARGLTFPMRYGQSDGARVRLACTARWRGHAIPLDTVGPPGASLLVALGPDGGAEWLDLSYVPPAPDSVAAGLPEVRPWGVE